MFRIILAFLLLGSIGLYSCSKTEYEYQQRPYKDIQLFTITGSYGVPVKGFIKNDTIQVNWNPDVKMPETITPEIVVSDKATVHPASGSPVAFSDTTRFRVTAEDGTVKTFYLKIVLNVPTPVLVSANGGNPIPWLSSTQVTLSGEYFLANTDTSEISVYMQRMADGVETQLSIIRNRTTNYQIVANLPAFSVEQDTGVHKVYVKAGKRVAKSVDLRFVIPQIPNAAYTMAMEQDGQVLHAGDSLRINYAVTDQLGGIVARYYRNNVKEVLLYTNNYDIIRVPLTNIRILDGAIKFKLPEAPLHVGKTLFQYRILCHSVPPGLEESSNYTLRGLLTASTILR